MDKQHVDDLIFANQLLERSRSKLESMKVGAYCTHATCGLGQIKSYDSTANRLIIKFENELEDKRIEPSFALKILNIVSDNDLIVRFKNNPEEISEKLKKDPLGLIIEFLKTRPGNKATAGDIDDVFANVVGRTGFKRWWTSIKKAAANDSRLMIVDNKITTIFLRENPISVESQIVEDFDRTKDLKGRVALAEKLLKVVTNPVELCNEISHIISELRSEIDRNDHKSNTADKLCAFWVCDELARMTQENVDYTSKAVELILAASDLNCVVEFLPASRYKHLLSLITRAYPDEWERRCLKILKTGNERVVNECVSYMIDNGREEQVRAKFEKWLNDKSIRTPVLNWFIKNRHSKKFSPVLSEKLTSPEMLKAIFLATDNDSLQSGSTKKIPLAELVCADRSLIHDLIEKASNEVILDLARVLMANQGFDSLSKKSLLARFIGVCPSVQNLISGANKSKNEQTAILKVSKWSLGAKKKEYESLVKEKIPANKIAIDVAREHGDLRENSEYKMARQDQETLMARKLQLESEFQVAQVFDVNDVDTSCVSIGTVVTVRQSSNGDVISFSILGVWDSDPDNNVISYKTPIAQSLMGKQIGDIVDVNVENNNERLKVESIKRWVDVAKK